MKLAKKCSLVLLCFVVLSPALKGMNTMVLIASGLPEAVGKKTVKVEFFVGGESYLLEIPLEVALISRTFYTALEQDEESKDQELELDNIIIQTTAKWKLEDLEALLEPMSCIAKQRKEGGNPQTTTAMLCSALSNGMYKGIETRMQNLATAIKLMDVVNYLDIPELSDALLYRFIGLYASHPKLKEALALYKNVDLAKRFYGVLGVVPQYQGQATENEEEANKIHQICEFYKDIAPGLNNDVYAIEGQKFIETFCSIDPKQQKSFVAALKENNALGWYLSLVLGYYMNNPNSTSLAIPYGITLWRIGTRLRAFNNQKKALDLSLMTLEAQKFSDILPHLLPFLEPLLGSEIYSLDLSNNGLSGDIPSELGQLTNLRWLTLSNNELSGDIPSELGQLTALEWLYLSNNKLSGYIPSELGLLTALQELDLFGNRLSGDIPSDLGLLTNLRRLDLSHNRLSGNIPSELEQLRLQTGLRIII